MPSIRYEAVAVTNLMTTELNALATATGVVSTTIYDNSLAANLYFWADVEIYVSSAVAPTANTIIELYFLPALDGTNFADGTAGTIVNMAHYKGGFPLRSAVGAQRIVLPGIVLPPQKFKAQIVNRSGQTMAATGNTLRMQTYREQLV